MIPLAKQSRLITIPPKMAGIKGGVQAKSGGSGGYSIKYKS
jgi:hypothetical protein